MDKTPASQMNNSNDPLTKKPSKVLEETQSNTPLRKAGDKKTSFIFDIKKEESEISEDESQKTRSDEMVEDSTQSESESSSDASEKEEQIEMQKKAEDRERERKGSVLQIKLNQQFGLEISQLNKSSKLGKGHQSELQKMVFNSGTELREETLMAEDNELEYQINTNISKKFTTAGRFQKTYKMLWSRADMKIFSAVESLKSLVGLLGTSIPRIPSFILQNIQLYEALFSFLHFHPCYIFNIIKSQILSLAQVKNLISILYSNNNIHHNSRGALLSLALMVFDLECSQTLFVSDLRNYKVGNTFWEIYMLFVKKDVQAMRYLAGFATRFLNDIMCKPMEEDLKGTIAPLEFLKSKGLKERVKVLHKTIKNGAFDSYDHEAEDILKEIESENAKPKLNIHKEIESEKVKSDIHKEIELEKKPGILKEIESENVKAEIPGLQANIEQIKEIIARKKKIERLRHMVKLFFKDMKHEIEYIINANYDIVSNELSHLHSRIIEIYIQKEREKGYKSQFKDSNFDMKRLEEEKLVEGMIERMRHQLSKQGKEFIFTIFFGIFLEMINSHVEYKIPVDKKYLAYVIKSGSNIKIVSEVLLCCLTRSKFSEQNDYYELNSSLTKPREKLIPKFLSKLAVEIYFNLPMSHLRESLLNAFDYRKSHFEISLELLINMHNLFCDVINKGSSFTFEELLIKGDEDPIYIIFQYLEFRTIPIDKMSADMLRMKINLKYCESVIDLNDPEFHKCPNCKILLPIFLLPKDEAQRIQRYQEEGWKCKKCLHQNKFTAFKCAKNDCSGIMDINMFRHHSILDKFYPEPDDLVKDYLDIITKLDYFKDQEDIWEVFQTAVNKYKKKDDLPSEMRLKSFISRCLENMEKNAENKEVKETNDDSYHSKMKDEQDIKQYFRQKMVNITQRALKAFEARKRHREYQIYLSGFLENIKFSLKEKMLLFNTAIADMRVAAEQIVAAKKEKDQKKKLIYLEQKADFDIKEVEAENAENINMATYLPIGVYTFNELKNKRVLIDLKFTEKELPVITKHLKFYIMSTDEGGFLINLVHTSEHWLNIFTGIIKPYFLNEVKLQTLEIEIERYIEMKRTCNYQARCTFGKSTIMATFDLTNLVLLLRQIESQVMIHSKTPLMKKKLAEAPQLRDISKK